LLPWWALRSLGSGRSHRSRCSCRAGRSLRACRTLRARCPDRSLRSLRSSGTRSPLWSRRSLKSLRTRVASVALLAPRPNRAYGSQRHVEDRDVPCGRMVLLAITRRGATGEGQTVGARQQSRGQKGQGLGCCRGCNNQRHRVQANHWRLIPEVLAANRENNKLGVRTRAQDHRLGVIAVGPHSGPGGGHKQRD
jgi:hypothetical protein